MEVKPGYKQTEVGVIPEEWEVNRLGEVLTRLANGALYRPSSDTGLPVTRIETIADGTIDMSRVGYGTRTPELEEYRMRQGDILFSHINSVDHIGKVALYGGQPPLYHGMNLLLLRAGSSLDCEYLFYWLGSHQGRKKAVSLARQAVSQASINTTDLKRVEIPIPPLPEQRAIAEALSDVDGLLGGLERLIAKKRDLKQAAMQQLLTGQTRLPGFHGEWEVKGLGDAGKCLRGVSYQGDSDLSTHDTIQTKRLLRSNNVQNAVVVTDEVQFVNAARVSSHQILKKRDILICMANGSKALVGKAGLFVVSDGYEYTFGAFMGCFRTNSAEANPIFVFYLFQTGRYRDYINNLLAGSSINNLRPSSIESLEFSTPPLPEQAAIAEVLTDMDAELAALEQRREKTRALKQAMMQELLTGRTRLV